MGQNGAFLGVSKARGTSLTPVTEQEAFVLGLYSSLDSATARVLERLSRKKDVVPSCRPGCCHCCRFHIQASMLEIHVLAQFVKRTFSRDRIRGLRLRTKKWHDWDQSRPGRGPEAAARATAELDRYEPCCPMLIRGRCSVYPVRPMVCRIHFVESEPSRCLAATRMMSSTQAPVTISAMAVAARPFSMKLKAYVEAGGRDFSRSIVLLPHGLAMEMAWDFALSP